MLTEDPLQGAEPPDLAGSPDTDRPGRHIAPVSPAGTTAERVDQVNDRVTALKRNFDRLLKQGLAHRKAEIIAVAVAAAIGLMLGIYLSFVTIDQQDQINDQRANLITADANRVHTDEVQHAAVCQALQGLRAAFTVSPGETTVRWTDRYDTLLVQLTESANMLKCG